MERRLCIPEHELILLESDTDTVIDSQSNKCIEQASASLKKRKENYLATYLEGRVQTMQEMLYVSLGGFLVPC